MELLKVGMELELIDDLDCGMRVINQGEVFQVQNITGDKISLVNNSIGIGVFDTSEISKYFKRHINNINTSEDVKRVIFNDRVTVVILHSGAKGISKCLEEDEYNKETGYRIAYLKAKIKEMKKELKRY